MAACTFQCTCTCNFRNAGLKRKTTYETSLRDWYLTCSSYYAHPLWVSRFSTFPRCIFTVERLLTLQWNAGGIGSASRSFCVATGLLACKSAFLTRQSRRRKKRKMLQGEAMFDTAGVHEKGNAGKKNNWHICCLVICGIVCTLELNCHK